MLSKWKKIFKVCILARARPRLDKHSAQANCELVVFGYILSVSGSKLKQTLKPEYHVGYLGGTFREMKGELF